MPRVLPVAPGQAVVFAVYEQCGAMETMQGSISTTSLHRRWLSDTYVVMMLLFMRIHCF